MAPLLLRALLQPRTIAYVTFALALAFGALQSARLKGATARLAAARVALVDPATHRSWAAVAREADRELGVCERQAALYATMIERQNASVSAMRAAASRAEAAAARAVSQASIIGRGERARAARVLSATPGGDTCRAADALILGSLSSPEARQ